MKKIKPYVHTLSIPYYEELHSLANDLGIKKSQVYHIGYLFLKKHLGILDDMSTMEYAFKLSVKQVNFLKNTKNYEKLKEIYDELYF